MISNYLITPTHNAASWSFDFIVCHLPSRYCDRWVSCNDSTRHDTECCRLVAHVTDLPWSWCCDMKRPHVMSSENFAVLIVFDWPGNSFRISAFLNRRINMLMSLKQLGNILTELFHIREFVSAIYSRDGFISVVGAALLYY